MELIDNVNETLAEDLKQTIKVIKAKTNCINTLLCLIANNKPSKATLNFTFNHLVNNKILNFEHYFFIFFLHMIIT